MQLRRVAPADAGALSGLCQLVFLDTYCEQGLRADLSDEAQAVGDTATLAALASDPRWRCLLLEHAVDGEAHVLGYASLRLDAADAELVRLYLHPRFQGRGLGRQLLHAAEAAAREAGARSLWLDCWDGNRRARAFYAACGYADTGPAVYRFGGRDYANRHLLKPLAA